MPLAATSFAFICARLLAALGVELLRMTASTAYSSALDLSTHARLWLLRLSRLPMDDHAGAGTTYFVMAGHIWPSSFGGCARLPSHRWRRRILRTLRTPLRGFGGQGIRGSILFLGFWGLCWCVGIGLVWVVGSFGGFSPGRSLGLAFSWGHGVFPFFPFYFFLFLGAQEF